MWGRRQVYLEAGRPVDAVIAANRAVEITSSLVPHRRHQALEKPYLLLATAREAVRPWMKGISYHIMPCSSHPCVGPTPVALGHLTSV